MTISKPLPIEIPSIDTARLTLRGHRLDDFEDCAAMWGDPNVTRFIGGRPLDRDEVWMKLMRHVGHWSLLGFGYWVLRERHSGRFVGEAGFATFRQEVEPFNHGLPEIGWALASWAHGQGFATEAGRAVVEWGEQNLVPDRTACVIPPGNSASIRVAEKLGYRECSRATYNGEPAIVFERVRPASGPLAR